MKHRTARRINDTILSGMVFYWIALTIALATIASPVSGCKAPTTTQPLAPGYLNSQDETLGASLAALNAFVNQETVNYASLTPALQAKEKTYLNTLIMATNAANTAYTAYHAGTQTEAQASTAINAAQTAQTTLVAQKEAH